MQYCKLTQVYWLSILGIILTVEWLVTDLSGSIIVVYCCVSSWAVLSVLCFLRLGYWAKYNNILYSSELKAIFLY